MDLLSISKVANLLDVSAQSVRNIPGELLRFIRTNGNQRRYDPVDVDAYIKNKAGVLSVNQIVEIVTPIAEKYKLVAVWLFGSYAREEPTPASDIDLLVDDGGTFVRLAQQFDIQDELETVTGKRVDVLTLESFSTDPVSEFTDAVNAERVIIYEKRN